MFSRVDVVAVVVVACCRHHNVCITVAAVAAAALVMPRFAHGPWLLWFKFTVRAIFKSILFTFYAATATATHARPLFSPTCNSSVALPVCVCVFASLTTFLWFGTHPKPRDNNKLVNVLGKVHRQASRPGDGQTG